MIIPTVGRLVHFYPKKTEALATIGDEPLAALVAAVWSPTCVNLHVIDANGIAHGKTSVLSVPDGAPMPHSGCWSWMPYQLGQAAKTEQMEAQLKGDK
jgi:hypothetical protein